MALCWIVENAVLHSVLRIAGLTDSGRNRGQLNTWKVSGRICLQCFADVDSAREHVRPVIARCAREYAVEVFREALRFHQSFAASVRASVEVRPLRSVSVESRHERLCIQRRQM